MDRRTFLGHGLRLAGLMVAMSLSVGCEAPRYAARGLRAFTPRQFAVLRAASERLLPAGPHRLGAPAIDVASAADQLLAKAHPALRADFLRLLDALESGAWQILSLAPFSTLAPRNRDRLLEAWRTSPLALQRQGVTALNKLCAMLYYMDARSWPEIGFGGPWVGRLDLGLGLDNQGPLPASLNPHVFERWSA